MQGIVSLAYKNIILQCVTSCLVLCLHNLERSWRISLQLPFRFEESKLKTNRYEDVLGKGFKHLAYKMYFITHVGCFLTDGTSRREYLFCHSESEGPG